MATSAATLALLTLAFAPAATAQGPGLFTSPGPERSTVAAVEPASAGAFAGRYRLVAVDFAELEGVRASLAQRPATPAALTLNLFEDALYEAMVDEIEPTHSGGYSVAARIAGDFPGQATLVVNGATVAGVVRTSRSVWRIRSAGDGLYAIEETDASKLPPPCAIADARERDARERHATANWAPVAASIPSAEAQGSVAGDRAALVALYESMDGPNWKKEAKLNWLSERPLSEWYGVKTDFNGRVTEISLLGVTGSAAGTISARIAELTELRSFSLYANGLTGSVPPGLCRLSRLQVLALGGNLLSGEIPACLGGVASLSSIDLALNALTGEIPASFARLRHLRSLELSGNDLTGSVPEWLGGLQALTHLALTANRLQGTIPESLGNLRLTYVSLGFNAGLSGPLPSGFARRPPWDLDIHGTRICVPASEPFRNWAPRGRFDSSGLVCGRAARDVAVVDLAFFYTRAARRAAGDVPQVEAAIDLMVAETNRIYSDSGVKLRIALVVRAETSYVETGNSLQDLNALANPDSLPALRKRRDAAGADLLYLLVGKGDACGAANIAARAQDAAGVILCRDGQTLAHELGHTMGLSHDCLSDNGYAKFCGPTSPPHTSYGYGYVNQKAFDEGAPASARWRTIMSYNRQCDEWGFDCESLGRFSDPGRKHLGDRLGVPGEGRSFSPGNAANAVRALNEVRHSVAGFRPSRRVDPEPPDDGDGPCVPDSGTLCLRDSRYAVSVEWSTADGRSGSATAAKEMTNDAGLFWFFDPGNWEVLIKVLDGCARNAHVWVYGASTTNLGYTIKVTDTATGVANEYRNEPGSAASAITDATAFSHGCRP